MIPTYTLFEINIVLITLCTALVVLSFYFQKCGCKALTNRTYYIFLLLTFALAVVIRSAEFASVPGGVNQDEAMAAVDAKALAQYGTDRLGMIYPVHFQAWGYGQMSVFLSYLMVPFIKIFGFSTLSIRLPMLFLSLGGLLFLYLLAGDVFTRDLALVILLFAAICPWHILQSRWSLDCNAFPHLLIISLYFLNHGMRKNKKILVYISMLFFGLSMYGYGISIYSVPVFLLFACIYLIIKKRVTVVDSAICLAIYAIVAWPFFAMIIINTFGLDSIETPWFTIPYFSDSIRSSDILFFSDNIPEQFLSNITSTLKIIFMVGDDYLWNVVPGFSTMYRFTIPFGLYGFYWLLKNCKKSGSVFLLVLFFAVGVFSCLITGNVNVNRANILMYSLIIMNGIGIYRVVKNVGFADVLLEVVFTAVFALFCCTYFTSYRSAISEAFYEDFGQAVSDVSSEQYDKIYITPDVQQEGAWYVSEILTLYYQDIDSKYYQSSDFNKKYVFKNPTEWEIRDNDNCAYVISKDEISLFDSSEYDITPFGKYASVIPKS